MGITAAQAVNQAVTYNRPMTRGEQVANVGGVQAGAARITSAFTKVAVSGGAAGSLILPNLTTGEAGFDMYVVSNETAGTIVVFPDVGETQNNVANAGLTIAANGFGIFVKERSNAFPYVAPDWASAAFT